MAHMRMQDVIATHPDAHGVWASHARMLLITGSAALLVAVTISLIWPTPGLWKVVLPLSVAKGVESVVFTCHGYWQAQGRVFRIAASNLVRAISASVMVSVGTLMSGMVLGVVLMAGAALIQLMLWELRQVPAMRVQGTSRDLLRRFGSLAPLGLVAMLLSLNQNIVRLIVEFHVGTAELGIFAASAYLVRTGAIAAQAIGQEGAPRVRAARANNDFRALYLAGVRSAVSAGGIGIVLLVFGSVFGPDVVAALYGKQFRPTEGLLLLILLAGIPLFGSTALSVTTVAVGRHGTYVAVVLASLLATMAAALALTPAWGLLGAAGAWAIGEALKLVLLLRLLRHSARQMTSGVSDAALAPETSLNTGQDE